MTDTGLMTVEGDSMDVTPAAGRTPAARLRSRITGGGHPLLAPGAANALTARIAEDLGAEAVYVTGAGVANTFLGSPDIGLTGMSEVRDHIAAIRDAVEVPIIADGDTGFGNAIGVGRTVRQYERAGASGIQLEDQAWPKKCGHFEGKAIVALDEMVGKIHAAVDARDDDDFVVIARTDAIAVDGDRPRERLRRRGRRRRVRRGAADRGAAPRHSRPGRRTDRGQHGRGRRHAAHASRSTARLLARALRECRAAGRDPRNPSGPRLAPA
jgi:hypothetical protein